MHSNQIKLKTTQIFARLNSIKFFRLYAAISLILTLSLTIFLVIFRYQASQHTNTLTNAYEKLDTQNLSLESQLASVSAALKELQNRDEYQINQSLEQEIAEINTTYKLAVVTYESLLELKDSGGDASKLDAEFTKALVNLADRNYATASDQLKFVQSESQKQIADIAAQFAIPASVTQSNTPPSSGYSRQSVSTGIGTFLVDLISADLASTRVIVDTASDNDCHNECPVLPLSEYVSRNGAFAGINGSYFCPASYPSCAGKTNTFDTLLMNKNKTYFNSDNNVYSTVPAVIFGQGWVRFVGQSLEWGRDTGIDSMIANQPLLVSGGNVVFGGDGDPKKGSKSNRSFVGSRGTTIYIGVVHNATVAESAHVLQSLGMENGLNLDAGGSTALWSGGYKVGPGRNLPNAILFTRR